MNTKHLALATSMILVAAICGQASARTANPGEKHLTHAVNFSGEVQQPENAFGAVMPSEAMQGNSHRYSGGPKSND